MSVFAIVLDEANPEAAARIEAEFPDCFRMSETMFLVASQSIADRIARAVGIKGDADERIQGGVVFRLSRHYSGYTSRALWDWLEHAEEAYERA